MLQYRNSSNLLITVILDLQYANNDTVEMIINIITLSPYFNGLSLVM